MAFAPSSVTL